MKAPPTVGHLTLRFLSLRDWTELTAKWLGSRQGEHEQSLRRAGATPIEIAQAVQEYAAKRSSYSLLIEMCKTYDGCTLVLERAAMHAGIRNEELYAALEGMDPESVGMAAMRACGWDIASERDDQGNA